MYSCDPFIGTLASPADASNYVAHPVIEAQFAVLVMLSLSVGLGSPKST